MARGKHGQASFARHLRDAEQRNERLSRKVTELTIALRNAERSAARANALQRRCEVLEDQVQRRTAPEVERLTATCEKYRLESERLTTEKDTLYRNYLALARATNCVGTGRMLNEVAEAMRVAPADVSRKLSREGDDVSSADGGGRGVALKDRKLPQ